VSELAKATNTDQIIRDIILTGNIGSLKPDDRAAYVIALAQHVGLDPITRPFDLLTLQGKIVVYANKSCTDQLRVKHGVSIKIVSREQIGDIYVVTAEATDKNGRTDSDIGSLNVKGLAGEALSNAMMKAGTKAKRRVTLSLCGLGHVSDESEVESIKAETASAAMPEGSRASMDDLNEKIKSRKRVENIAASEETQPSEPGQPLKEKSQPAFDVADFMAGLDQVAQANGWEPEEADALIRIALQAKGFARIEDTTPDWREKMIAALRSEVQWKKRDAKRAAKTA